MFLQYLVDQLRAVKGVVAVVLGGSYARGAQRPGSDLDVGIYYREQTPFSIDEIRRVAMQISSDKAPTVTDFYSWGPWVNGGAWIHTPVGKVDFLYRKIEQVRGTIEDAIAGKSSFDYAQQPIYGFHSVIYLAETNICLPLYDPEFVIRDIKALVASYPPAFKARILQDSLWSCEFTLMFARDMAKAGDVYNTVGCLARISGFLTQALFALNEVYFISDKKVMRAIDAFASKPADYTARLERILAAPGSTPEALSATVTALEGLIRESIQLAAQWYKPAFNL